MPLSATFLLHFVPPSAPLFKTFFLFVYYSPLATFIEVNFSPAHKRATEKHTSEFEAGNVIKITHRNKTSYQLESQPMRVFLFFTTSNHKNSWYSPIPQNAFLVGLHDRCASKNRVLNHFGRFGNVLGTILDVLRAIREVGTVHHLALFFFALCFFFRIPSSFFFFFFFFLVARGKTQKQWETGNRWTNPLAFWRARGITSLLQNC